MATTSQKRKLTDYIRKCIKTKQEVKTTSGKYGFIPHEGEDKLFEQCYKEGDKIREQFPDNYYLSEKYCHLVKVCENGNVYFVCPIKRQSGKKKKESDREERWRYFKDMKRDKKNICPSGISVYTVYGLVFGSMIFRNEERELLEKNVYKTKGQIVTHHITKYEEPKLERGVPVFNEDAKNLIIYKKDIHDNLIYLIPSTGTSDEEAKKFDERLESVLSKEDQDKIRISSRKAIKGKNTEKVGRIILIDAEKGKIESITDFMNHAGPEYPKCIVTYKGPKENWELYNNTIYQCLNIITDLLNQKMGAGRYDIELYTGLEITAYKHVDEQIKPEDIKVTQPVEL